MNTGPIYVEKAVYLFYSFCLGSPAFEDMRKGKGIKYEGHLRFGGSRFRLSFSYLPSFALSPSYT